MEIRHQLVGVHGPTSVSRGQGAHTHQPAEAQRAGVLPLPPPPLLLPTLLPPSTSDTGPGMPQGSHPCLGDGAEPSPTDRQLAVAQAGAGGRGAARLSQASLRDSRHFFCLHLLVLFKSLSAAPTCFPLVHLSLVMPLFSTRVSSRLPPAHFFSGRLSLSPALQGLPFLSFSPLPVEAPTLHLQCLPLHSSATKSPTPTLAQACLTLHLQAPGMARSGG